MWLGWVSLRVRAALVAVSLMAPVGARPSEYGFPLRPRACRSTDKGLWAVGGKTVQSCRALAGALARLPAEPRAALELAQAARREPALVPTALRVSGRAQLLLKDYAQALAAFDAAGNRYVEWDPLSLHAYAVTLTRSGQPSKAEALYHSVLRHGPARLRAFGLLPSQMNIELALVLLWQTPSNASVAQGLLQDAVGETPELRLLATAAERLAALAGAQPLAPAPVGLDSLPSIEAALAVDPGLPAFERWMLVAALCEQERPALAAEAWQLALASLPKQGSPWRSLVVGRARAELSE